MAAPSHEPASSPPVSATSPFETAVTSAVDASVYPTPSGIADAPGASAAVWPTTEQLPVPPHGPFLLPFGPVCATAAEGGATTARETGEAALPPGTVCSSSPPHTASSPEAEAQHGLPWGLNESPWAPPATRPPGGNAVCGAEVVCALAEPSRCVEKCASVEAGTEGNAPHYDAGRQSSGAMADTLSTPLPPSSPLSHYPPLHPDPYTPPAEYL